MVGGNSIEFPPGGPSQSRCVIVMIRDDVLLEDEETFCLTLQSSDTDITITDGVTCITVDDIDRK